jgi:flavin reductase (DIM6/NTAB) family NADH-FMN oxidoreductase RutF
MTETQNGASDAVSEEQFKLGMRQLAAAVNIITAAKNGTRNGLTATAACSISADPPQLLICVNAEAGAHDLIRDAGSFCLNVLAREQEDVAKRFAGMDSADKSQRYDLGEWTELSTGAPVLEGALANFDCEIVQQITAGTHSIFIGKVVGIQTRDDGHSLIYGEGQFTGISNQSS